jgi:hypothetical protein
MNLFDNSPIQGVSVVVNSSKGGFLTYKSNQPYRMTTNANGEFGMDASYKKSYSYSISMNTPSDNLSMNDTTSDYLETFFYSSTWYKAISPYSDNQQLYKNKSQYIEFKIVPTARLHVIAIDQPPLITTGISVEVDDPNMPFPAFFIDELGSATTNGQYKFVVPTDNQVKIRWSVDGSVTFKSKIIALEPFKKAITYIYY